MTGRTWPYGTTRKATVEEVIKERKCVFMVLTDETGEGHLLMDGPGQYEGLHGGDTGTLTFTQGGPLGGYWRFEKERGV